MSVQIADQKRARSRSKIEKAFGFPRSFLLKRTLTAAIQRYCVSAKSRLTPLHAEEYSEIAKAATLLGDFLEGRKDHEEKYSEIAKAVAPLRDPHFRLSPQVAVLFLAIGNLKIDDLAALQASVPQIRALAAAAILTNESMDNTNRGRRKKDRALRDFLRDLLKMYVNGTGEADTLGRNSDEYTGPLFRFVNACVSIADRAFGAKTPRGHRRKRGKYALGKALERVRNDLRKTQSKPAETKSGPPPGWK